MVVRPWKPQIYNMKKLNKITVEAGERLLAAIILKRYKNLIDKIQKEASLPTCMSYDYDPTPSGEERLQRILKMIENFKKDL